MCNKITKLITLWENIIWAETQHTGSNLVVLTQSVRPILAILRKHGWTETPK